MSNASAVHWQVLLFASAQARSRPPAGAVLAGLTADAFGLGGAIWIVAVTVCGAGSGGGRPGDP